MNDFGNFEEVVAAIDVWIVGMCDSEALMAQWEGVE